MPRRPPVALALLATLALSACAGGSGRGSPAPQGLPLPAVNGLSAATLIACRNLKASLPHEITPGAALRAVTPLSDSTAAWGTPAITLRCGVQPGDARDDPYTFNGVTWAQHDNGASRLWTTTGRPVNVVVEVPDAYSSQAELIGALATAVKTSLS